MTDEVPIEKYYFLKGKYTGKSYEEVRILYPEYLFFIISQPAYKVVEYFDFINYCMEFLSAKEIK